MKCKNCGAETRGKFCEYCGSEMPEEKTPVSITNNYFNGTPAQETDSTDNIGGCPKCGSKKVTFKREQLGTVTQSISQKSYYGKKAAGQSVSQTTFNTIGICNSCGYTWDPNIPVKEKQNKTWLWVIGWICIFPVPLTILLLRKKDLKPAVKYGIIAAAWVLYLLIGIFGGIQNDTTPSTTSSIGITVTNQAKNNEVTTSEKYTADLSRNITTEFDYEHSVFYTKDKYCMFGIYK